MAAGFVRLFWCGRGFFRLTLFLGYNANQISVFKEGDPMKSVRLPLVLLVMCMLMVFASGCPVVPPAATTVATTTGKPLVTTAKPVIYLYPPAESVIHVTLEYNGELTCAYPVGAGEWTVTAYPDGRLVNHADGKEYSYLYWEGLCDTAYDFSKGFVVRGTDTAAFLQQKLALLGLTPREYNEFIVYWLPLMQENPYNLVTFQGIAYTSNALLTITPRPDSLLRVFMAYKPLDHAIAIEEQTLTGFQRTGFTVVEWGGSCIR
jgi:hypothetical protein